MSIVDWLSILVGISSGALAGGISYGMLRSEVRALRSETEVQREEIRECRQAIYSHLENSQPSETSARVRQS